jgi:flagellin
MLSSRITEDAMASILNNVAALGASRQLGITNAGLNKTIERLTTGRRINRASDDAAGLGISNRIGADIRIAGQARRNANDGVSFLQVADGVLDEATNLLTRAAELTQQADTGTVDANGVAAIDLEYKAIKATLDDLVKAKFNGSAVFSATATSVALGSDFAALDVKTGTMTFTLGATAKGDAAKVTADLKTVSDARASIGANMQTLTSYGNALGIQVENLTAAYSQIRDANVADEVVNLSKFQVLNQSGISALSQANQSSQSILALLR